MIETQICIVGAGPAGLSVAMNLNKLGVDCVLIDKEQFPRDKVCGDSFNGQVTHLLNRLDPNYLKEMEEQGIILKNWDYAIADQENRNLRMTFDQSATPRLLAKRIDFDEFLMNKIRQMPHVTVMENVDITSVKHVSDGSIVTSRDNKTQVKAEMIIGASGETSRFYHEITQKPIRNGDAYIYTRAYFKNVDILPTESMGVHIFYKPMIMLYTSILPGGIVTVEVGIKQTESKRYNVNLRERLFEILDTYEPLKDRFKNAALVGKTVGTSIQLSYKRPKRSGKRFLLAGAAVQSMHPLIGYGVAHAMAAGEIAAQVAAEAVAKQDFSEAFLSKYDKLVKKKMGSEIILNRMITFIFDHPKILLPMMFTIGKQLSGILTEKGFSTEFLKPSFYLKRLSGVTR
jgi:flavin-dependent dehydrogenase